MVPFLFVIGGACEKNTGQVCDLIGFTERTNPFGTTQRFLFLTQHYLQRSIQINDSLHRL